MNFIGSVLIAEAGEVAGFYVLIYLLIEHDMRALFLPVRKPVNNWTLGFPRAALKEFLDGTTGQVSHAKAVRSPAKDIDDD
jgi:hypothetical protein